MGDYSINPIMNNMQMLQNYEYMLYGGSNYGTSAPSYTNNYVGTQTSSLFNNFAYPYGNYNYNYTSSYNPSFNGYSNGSVTNVSNTTNASFQGLSNEDWQALKSYYNKGLSPSESIGAAAIGGVSCAVMNNPRIVVHPLNTVASLSETNKIFAGCKDETSKLYELWRGKDTNGLIQDAYAATNKLEARKLWKIGAFRKRYSKEEYENLLKIMKDALKTGNVDEIAKATAELKKAYTTNGWITKPFTKIKELIAGKPATISEETRVGEIEKLAKELQESSKCMPFNFKKALCKGGLFGAPMFAAIEILMGIGKIRTAFEKDSSTGWKQIGQTTVKAAGNAAGWALGEAAAVWAMGQAGATIGTLFGPGIGTLIGGLVGVVGGSIGMCITGKLTRAIVGQDVADKVETEKLASTAEGQTKLVQYAYEKAQNGEKMDTATKTALQKAINLYA